MSKAYSTLVDINPYLKCYPTLIKNILHSNALSLMIITKADNKVSIPKDITVGTYELIDNDSYSKMRIP